MKAFGSSCAQAYCDLDPRLNCDLKRLFFPLFNYLRGYQSLVMTKRYGHANKEQYGAAIEALVAEALAADRWKHME